MKQEIIQIIKDVRPEFDFSQEVNFIEEGMLDSFDLVSLVTDLESKFGVVIDGMDIVPENFSSLDAIEALVNKSKK